MNTIKLNGKAQVELAREIAGIAGGSVEFEGTSLRFDSEDTENLEAIARDAEGYWMMMKKRTKATAAEAIWRKVAEVRTAESCALRYAR